MNRPQRVRDALASLTVVEIGQRWRSRDRRRPIIIKIDGKADGRAMFLDHDGKARVLDCCDLRRRFALIAD